MVVGVVVMLMVVVVLMLVTSIQQSCLKFSKMIYHLVSIEAL